MKAYTKTIVLTTLARHIWTVLLDSRSSINQELIINAELLFDTSTAICR